MSSLTELKTEPQHLRARGHAQEKGGILYIYMEDSCIMRCEDDLNVCNGQDDYNGHAHATVTVMRTEL